MTLRNTFLRAGTAGTAMALQRFFSFSSLTKTLRGGSAKSAGLYLASAGIGAVANALLIPLLVNYLTPDEYGKLSIFQSLYSIATLITFLSMRPPVVRELTVKSHHDAPGYVATALALVGVLTGFIAILGLIFSRQLSSALSLPPWLIVAVLLAGGAQSLYQVYLSILQSEGEALRYTIVQTALLFLNVGLCLFLLFDVGLGWWSRAVAYMVCAAFGGGLAIAAAASRKLLGRVKARYAIELASLGGATMLATIFVANFDRLVVGGLFSPTEAGLYTLSSQICMVVTLLASAIMLPVAPWAYRTMSSCSNAVSWFRFYRVLIAVGVGVIFVAVGLGVATILIVYSFDQWSYRNLLFYFPWALIANSSLALTYVFSPVLYHFKSATLLTGSAIVLVVCNGTLLLILPRLYGPPGVAMALSLARFLQLGCVVVMGGWLVTRALKAPSCQPPLGEPPLEVPLSPDVTEGS